MGQEKEQSHQVNTPNFNKQLDQNTKMLVRRISNISRRNSFKRKKGKFLKELRMLPLLVKYFGKCFWCDIPVIYNPTADGRLRHDGATVDHVVSRYFRRKGEEVLKVLACYRCNAKRADIENKIYAKAYQSKIKLSTPAN